MIKKRKDEEISNPESRCKDDILFEQQINGSENATKLFQAETSFRHESFSLFNDMSKVKLFMQSYLELEKRKVAKKSTLSISALEERRQRRLSSNRIAAKECRRKKKKYLNEMEKKIKLLEQENTRLKKEVQDLQSKLIQGSENYQLMKQVQELNTKLGITRS